MKFKNGDRVRIISECPCGCKMGENRIGEVGIVDGNNVIVKNGSKIYLDGFSEDMFELDHVPNIEEFL